MNYDNEMILSDDEVALAILVGKPYIVHKRCGTVMTVYVTEIASVPTSTRHHDKSELHWRERGAYSCAVCDERLDTTTLDYRNAGGQW